MRRAVRDDRDFAAVQHWKYRHLFVDEFQDINPLQLHLLEAWRAGRPDLCVVGDPDQAIYGWNGAESAVLAEFPERYPGSTIVRLETNYRSSPQIVRVASSVLDVRGRHTTQADGPVPSISSYPTDVVEAAAAARRVRDRRGPTMGWHHLAVLAHQRAARAARRSAAGGERAVPGPRWRPASRTARGPGVVRDPATGARALSLLGSPTSRRS